MKLIQCFLTKNDCYKAGRTITPKGVMVHSTGANNPTLKRYVQPNVDGIGKNQYNNDWNRAGTGKCVHAFIGKLENGSIATVQTLPWNFRGWHAGSGAKGSANNTHIGFEICEDGLSDKTYFNKVYREAVELTAMLCKKYNLDPKADGVVICHAEGHDRKIASNHGDVEHWFPKHGKTMDDFRADVAKEMGGSTKADTTSVKTVSVDPAESRSAAYSKSYTVTASELNMRTKAGEKDKDGNDVPIIKSLPKGSKVRCYGYYTKNGSTVWLYVQDSTGVVGYCSKLHLK